MTHLRHPTPGDPAQASTRRLRVALGTWVAIEAKAPGGAEVEQAAINAAYAAINSVERAMHPHSPGSDLARINTAPLHTPVRVQPDTWRLLQFARRLHDLSDGVFDPCLPSLPGRFQDVELGTEPILICHARVEIDLGGIAKGHAIDRAVEKLSELGCSAGLVNAGGDLRVFGEREEIILLRRAGEAPDPTIDAGQSARVGVSEWEGATYRPLALKNAALAVSDFDATDRPIEHQGYYNRTGRGRTQRYAAVIAKNAMAADALTKCVLLCSPERSAYVLRELEAQPA
jgi:FAD:protein FMN transferase